MHHAVIYVTIVPFCVVMLEGHGMAGTYVVVSGHRCRMFGYLGDRVMYLTDGGPGPGHVVVSQSCLGHSSERMY